MCDFLFQWPLPLKLVLVDCEKGYRVLGEGTTWTAYLKNMDSFHYGVDNLQD